MGSSTYSSARKTETERTSLPKHATLPVNRLGRFSIEGISDIGYIFISDIAYVCCLEARLTDFPISDSSRGMGRPPLNVKAILVRLPEGMDKRIDALVGKNKRAEFIRDAVSKELQRQERAAGKQPPESDDA